MNEEYDDELEGPEHEAAESPAEEGDEDSRTDLDEQEILSLFQELRQESTADDVLRDNAKAIEMLCVNLPARNLPNYTNYVRQFNTPQTSMQILNNLCLTWAALLTKDRPSVTAVPQNSDLAAVSAAKIATKLIEYNETELDTSDKWHTSAMYAAQHGTAMMKIIYDTETDRIEWAPLSIFDCFLQNRTQPKDVEWALVRNYVTPHEAKEMLKSVRSGAGTPDTVDYRDAMDIVRKGVEKWEIWYLPCSRYEKGLYACVIDGAVVEAMNYPYTFAEPDGDGQKSLLPIVWWNARKNRAATLGTSWSQDCGQIQASINSLFSKITDDALHARQVMILPSSLRNTDLVDEENARIWIDPANADSAALIKWVNPAPIDQGVQNALKQNIDSMYVTSGISQATSGDAGASTSGKALAYAAKLDADKHSDAFKNFEAAQKAAWELSLKLVQKYYTAPRQFNISGDDSISFMGADLAGISVKLEPRSSYESMSSKKLENAKADMAGGFAGREALLDTAPTPMTAGIAMFANDLIERFLAGEDVQITPETAPPEIVIQQVDKRIQSALLARDVGVVDALNSFKAEYLRSLAQAQAPDAAPAAPAADAQGNIPSPIAGAGEEMQQEAAKGLS